MGFGASLVSGNPFDLRPQSAQVLDKPRVTAVDVMDIVDLGHSVGTEPGEHQAGTGPDI